MAHFPLYDDHTSGPTSRPTTLLCRLLTPFQLCFLADDLNSIMKPSCKYTHKWFSMEVTSPLKSTKPACNSAGKKNCYSDFWHTSVRILAFLKPTAKQIIQGKMGLTKTKSRYKTFKSWLKDAPKMPHTNILSEGSVPTAILPGIFWQWDYLLNNWLFKWNPNWFNNHFRHQSAGHISFHTYFSTELLIISAHYNKNNTSPMIHI